jgi:Uma2 family endonuclease
MAEADALRYLEDAMVTATLMTVEEFAALPEDGQMHELVEGKLQSMPPPHSLHTRILHAILLPLAQFVRTKGLGQAFAEAGYLLSDDPATIRQPDISFQTASRLAAQPRGGYFRGAPDLAFEIVSPSDKAGDLDLKVRQYLAAGAQAVVVIYPVTRSIWVHRPEGSPHLLSVVQTLEFPELLPGWSMAASEVFAPLDAEV